MKKQKRKEYKEKHKEKSQQKVWRLIIQNSFWHILFIYSLIIVLISFGLLSRYALQFNLLAIVIAILGILLLYEKEKPIIINKKIYWLIFFLTFAFIFFVRAIPYLKNDIPLGYDAGLYKYGIEHGLENKDKWILEGGMEPGFLYLMKFFSFFFSTNFILTYLLIVFCLILGFSIYLTAKTYFNDTIALLSLIIYSISVSQFKTFALMYYKNIIGMGLMLFSLYFLKKINIQSKNKGSKKKAVFFMILFLVCSGLIGSIHRPTFYIFFLSYFFYTLFLPLNFEGKKIQYNFHVFLQNFFFLLIILLVFSLFYLGDFKPAIFTMIEPLLQGFIKPGEVSGTFMNFLHYQFFSLFYLPFSFLGVALLFFKKNTILKEKRNYLFFACWFIINLAIIVFKFFFFNRFIIHFDILLIILAAYGFYSLSTTNKKLVVIFMILLLACGAIFLLQETYKTKPLIDKASLETISYLKNTEPGAYVLTTASYYGPWLLAYSERKAIVPGLFDYNKHSEEEWISFWKAKTLPEINGFLSVYEKPLYIFVSKNQKEIFQEFPECFSLLYEHKDNKIYKYLC